MVGEWSRGEGGAWPPAPSRAALTIAFRHIVGVGDRDNINVSMRPLISQRSTLFTESVIREMTRLCQRHDGVNLAQGFPDFPAPEVLKEEAARAVRADINQYAITWGAKRLREALSRKTERV